MKGKRHFLTKRTSLFGSEHEENSANCISSSVSPSIIRDHIPKSYSYGDWWKPVENRLHEEAKPQFFGRIRSAANSCSMSEIAGFHNGAVDGNSSDGPEATSLNNSGSGKTELGPAGDQKGSPTKTQPSVSVHFGTGKGLDDLRSGDTDIIEKAKTRAKERQLMKKEQENHEGTGGHSFLTDLESSLIKKYTAKNHESRAMDPSTALELTRPMTDESDGAQKELLERRMSERPPVTHTVQPPWYTEDKSIGKIVSSQSKSDPIKWNFQRTCNQIDFPSYTAEEMRGARPTIIMEARHKKCTWMPSLAPEVVAESQVGRRSICSKLSSSESLEATEAPSTKSPRRANDVNLPPYPKISAPYAMD